MGHSFPARLRFAFANLLMLFRRTFAVLVHNDPLRMAGATAFFTSFALPFILILLTQFLGLLINPLHIRRELFQDLASVLGVESVRQVIDTLIAFRQLADNLWITVLGFIFLLLVATTLLMVIKGSINQLWRIKVVEGRGFLKRLGTRMKSVMIIMATGFLIIISILAEAVRAQMGKSISELSPSLAFYINSVMTYILSLLFVTLWFGIIFRMLPDARVSWKVALIGAFMTAILFTIGKYVLRLLLINSSIGTLYGASASIVLILLFVFYSSLILYFGAAFTRVWAEYYHHSIRPLPYATRYKVTDVHED